MPQQQLSIEDYRKYEKIARNSIALYNIDKEDREDAISEGLLEIIQTIKVKPSAPIPYLRNASKWRMLKFIRNQLNKHSTDNKLSKEYARQLSYRETCGYTDRMYLHDAMRVIANSLPLESRVLLKLLYWSEISLTDASRVMGLTYRQTVTKKEKILRMLSKSIVHCQWNQVKL